MIVLPIIKILKIILELWQKGMRQDMKHTWNMSALLEMHPLENVLISPQSRGLELIDEHSNYGF